MQDPPQAAYNKSLRQNGLQNRQQLQVLHDQFDEICNSIKRSKQSKHEQRNDSLNKNLRWRIPYAIITFCANRIKELLNNPDEVKNWSLMPWVEFKETIFGVYDHRIQNAHEINGSANMSYCALNEYVLIYFMDLYRDRKIVEKKLVEMFINLRYFYY